MLRAENRCEQCRLFARHQIPLWTRREKEFGSGTGKIKLRYVYDMFIVRFPWMAQVITFETFSGLVDKALEEMRVLLETNKQV